MYTASDVLCLSIDVPEHVVQSWTIRETYISIAELLIAPILVISYPCLFQNQDILWFIDNQAALGALVKAASSAEDMSELSLLCSLSLAILDARTWFEYVPSALNMSDGLSREGWPSALPSWQDLQPEVDWTLFCSRLHSALQMISALGVRV